MTPEPVRLPRSYAGRTDSSSELSFPCSEIVYVFKGRVHFHLHDNPDGYVRGKELVFLPAGDRARCLALKRGSLLTLRLDSCLRMCHSFSIEELMKKMHEAQKPDCLYPLHRRLRTAALPVDAAGKSPFGLQRNLQQNGKNRQPPFIGGCLFLQRLQPDVQP